MTDQITIYALVDACGGVHYVGQTRRLKERQREHAKKWPELSMIILEQSDQEHAAAAERALIARYATEGTLRNVLDTVEGGRRRSERMKRAWSRRQAQPTSHADYVDLPLRLPATLAVALKAVAVRECRSVQQQVRWCLWQHAEITEALAARAAPVPRPEQESADGQ